MSSRLFTNFRWGLTGEAQSMLVEGERVVSRGSGVAPEGVDAVNLDGRYLLPSLTDCHCHILPTGLDLAKLHLGAANSREAVLDAVRGRHRSHPDGWLLAVHYDQNKWGGEHLTRTELDTISSSRPILLRHVNGHAGVANTAALQAAGVGLDEADPDDGSYGRDASGKLTGVAFEGAHERVSGAIPNPTFEESVEAILAAARSMASMGLGSATDMQTNARDLPAYRAAVERGCPIELRLYMVWKDVFGPRATDRNEIEALRDGPGPIVAGVKLFADGAIGSATAAIYGGYAGREPSLGGTSGQLMYSKERLIERVKTAHDAGFQVATHAIGDYALDLVLDAYEATGGAARHRIEHAMLLSDQQIERLHRLGCQVAMQPEFLVRFGHAYRAQLGHARAGHLKRFRSVLDAGVALAFSSDRPICAGSPWTGVECASARPDGFDPAENLSRREAIERYLTPAARIGGDANRGALNPGELCDAIVMDSDPLLPGEPAAPAKLQVLSMVGTGAA
ncbi:MAG TPA: amidohydrolase [Fimbriimonadaceae bacterium]|nr:amidohydrolase [Fimbriimonadaceae bacterium]